MGRRPLTEDQHRNIALHAQSGVLAIAVVRGGLTAERAVAELALIVPCRPDLVDQVIALVERGMSLGHADWPPSETTLRLLGRTREVTLGSVALVGPGGVRVDQVTLTGKNGGPPVRYLRLRRYDAYIGDYRTVEQLAQHVDIAALVEEPETSSHHPKPSGA